MEDKHLFPKQQLEIVQVQEPKAYSSGTKFLLPVMAKNLSLQEGDPLKDKAVKYTVFNQAIQDHIKPLQPGARFLCDIEERERPDSEYGPDRNIVQIYVDGKPISQKKGGGGGGGGGGYRGRSLEDDLVLENVKRLSIEGQTAIAQIGNVLTCSTPLDGEALLGLDKEAWKRILGKYWQAVEKSLDNFLAQPKGQVSPPKRDQRAQDAKITTRAPDQVSNRAPPTTDPIKHVGDLLTRAGKLAPPVSREELCVAVNVHDPTEIKDLEAAWKTAQELSATKAKQPELPF